MTAHAKVYVLSLGLSAGGFFPEFLFVVSFFFRHLERIVRPDEVQRFGSALQEHQKAVMSDGEKRVENTVRQYVPSLSVPFLLLLFFFFF